MFCICTWILLLKWMVLIVKLVVAHHRTWKSLDSLSLPGKPCSVCVHSHLGHFVCIHILVILCAFTFESFCVHSHLDHFVCIHVWVILSSWCLRNVIKFSDVLPSSSFIHNISYKTIYGPNWKHTADKINAMDDYINELQRHFATEIWHHVQNIHLCFMWVKIIPVLLYMGRSHFMWFLFACLTLIWLENLLYSFQIYTTLFKFTLLFSNLHYSFQTSSIIYGLTQFGIHCTWQFSFYMICHRQPCLHLSSVGG
jgi:hypothetical protein